MTPPDSDEEGTMRYRHVGKPDSGEREVCGTVMAYVNGDPLRCDRARDHDGPHEAKLSGPREVLPINTRREQILRDFGSPAPTTPEQVADRAVGYCQHVTVEHSHDWACAPCIATWVRRYAPVVPLSLAQRILAILEDYSTRDGAARVAAAELRERLPNTDQRKG